MHSCGNLFLIYLIVQNFTLGIAYYCVTTPAGTVTHPELISKPSKSALKREYLALQALGEQLMELTTDQLHSIGLPEQLLDAVVAAKSMSARGAMRRQKQLIGKIMRNTDAEPIKAAIDAYGRNDRMEKQVFHNAEQWRERLTAGGGDDLGEFFDLIGHRNEMLAAAVGSWFSAPDDNARRLARRKIFREIHQDLTSKMQKQATSI
jgi:ribosome-associated protein